MIDVTSSFLMWMMRSVQFSAPYKSTDIIDITGRRCSWFEY